MSDRVHGGPGTCVAEVGEEARLTASLREALTALQSSRARARDDAVAGLASYLGLESSGSVRQDGVRRLRVDLPREQLDRLQRIHYRRRRPGAWAPTSFAVYLPEGVVEFRATSQEAS